MNNAPCKDCKARTLGCHQTCDIYKAYIEEGKRIKENRRKSKEYYGYVVQRLVQRHV